MLYPNVAGGSGDTDVVVRALPLGADVTYMLRSEASPESETMSFDLPSGWQLHDPGDGSGQIQIVSGSGKVMAVVFPAMAVDAQGQTVPTSYQVASADQLTLTVSHDGGDYAYPIMVDPAISPDYQTTSVYSDWEHCSYVVSGSVKCNPSGSIFSPFDISDSGWKFQASQYYAAGDYAEYVYTAPKNAYIFELVESGVTASHEHSAEYGGIRNYSGGWSAGGSWENVTTNTSGSGSDYYDTGSPSGVEYKYCARPDGSGGCLSQDPGNPIVTGSDHGNYAVFGLYAESNYTDDSNYASAALTDATVLLADTYSSSITTPTQ